MQPLANVANVYSAFFLWQALAILCWAHITAQARPLCSYSRFWLKMTGSLKTVCKVSGHSVLIFLVRTDSKILRRHLFFLVLLLIPLLLLLIHFALRSLPAEHLAWYTLLASPMYFSLLFLVLRRYSKHKHIPLGPMKTKRFSVMLSIFSVLSYYTLTRRRFFYQH